MCQQFPELEAGGEAEPKGCAVDKDPTGIALCLTCCIAP